MWKFLLCMLNTDLANIVSGFEFRVLGFGFRVLS